MDFNPHRKLTDKKMKKVLFNHISLFNKYYKMDDKIQLISNLQPLNIYQIKNDINYSYDSIIKVYELLNKNTSISKLTSFINLS